MSDHMLLLRDEGIDWSQHQGDRNDQLFQRFVDWAKSLDDRKLLVAVDGLQTPSAGKTVRRRGAGLVLEGPYAEGREAVLGYFIVRVESEPQLLALCEECPHAQISGAIELREVRSFPKPMR